MPRCSRKTAAMRETAPPDLDVVNLGMMMAEISPPRLGLRIDESDVLSLHVAGSATIFALALARLGGRVGLISRVGDDQVGRWLLKQVRAEGIDTKAVAIVGGELTPLLLASVDHDGNKTFSFYRFAGFCDPLITFRAADVDDRYLARGRIFDLAEGSLRNATLRHGIADSGPPRARHGPHRLLQPEFPGRGVGWWCGRGERCPSGCPQPGRSGDHERNRSDVAC